jgi:DNA-binding response OmpR family regulator
MSKASRLLVVDDDQDLRDTLAEQLCLYGEFEVSTAEAAAQAVHRVRLDRIDLAIMDVGLPDMDGREAVKLMRRNGFRSPVIMLTAQGSESDTVLGLEAGANDYVVKPFKFAVLLARIRAQLRQYEASEDAVFQIGPYIFRPGAKLLVSEKGSKLKLTEKETAILRFLYRAGQKVVSRDILLSEVWGYNANVTTHTLEPTSTVCARRSRTTRRPRGSSSPNRAGISYCRKLTRIRDGSAGRMALDDDIAALSRAPLFCFMERDALRLIAFAAEHKVLRANAVLFRKGDRSDGAFLVNRGSVALDAEDGRSGS